MTTPLSPNPDSSASRRFPDASMGASAGSTGPFADPVREDLPTVISSAKPRGGAFDSKVADSLSGRRLAHFELIEPVGAGGMAAVIKARDLELGRFVALKILPSNTAHDTENINRFKQEARAAAKLDHENVSRVYYCGEDQGLHFIAFEFVEGDNLRQLMDASGGKIPVGEAINLMLQVAQGLSHASSRGVVHRDIKPSNIIVTPEGRAKIVDMGLARSLDAGPGGQLTQSGVTLGTFDYISPEQAIEPRLADTRSDLYSLGCTFYHALTAHIPVPEGTAAKKLDAHKNVTPPDPRTYNSDIPDELATILGKMMAKDPSRRYQHPDHLVYHLRTLAKKVGIAAAIVSGGSGSVITPNDFHEPLVGKPMKSWLSWGIAAMSVIVAAVAITVAATLPPKVIIETVQVDRPVAVDPKINAEPKEKPAPIVGPRDAATVDEWVNLAKLGASHIRLTGMEYDLTRYTDANGKPAEMLMSGDDVKIEGLTNPTVRVAYAPGSGARAKALSLKGPGEVNKGTALVRNIRFLFASTELDAESTGLTVNGFDRITFESCSFVSPFRKGGDGPASLHIPAKNGALNLKQCYFAPGAVGISIDGPVRVNATECAFAPHHSLFRITRPADLETTESEPATFFRLMHCTAMMSVGSLFEIGDDVPCKISAGHCLFASPDRFGPAAEGPVPVIVRQRGARDSETKYEPNKPVTSREPLPNVYVNVAAYAEGDQSFTFAECATEKMPFTDFEKVVRQPWLERDPFSMLTNDPKEVKRAFTQNLRLVALRPGGNSKTSIIGTKFLAGDPLYTMPLPSVDSDLRDATVKVWDPNVSTLEDPPIGVYSTFKQALASCKPGDTLLIRYTGRLEIDPIEFDRADTNLIIKADATYKPVLIPADSSLRRSPGLVKLYGGKLTLEGLQFRLPAGRVPAVVVMPAGGQLEVRNCLITLEEGEDLSAIAFNDPRADRMMSNGAGDKWPVPKVQLENVLVRGKGTLFSVNGSRSFEIDVRNALAALDGTLIDIKPSNVDPSVGGSSILKLSRVTTCLSGEVVRVNASEKKDINLGLTKLEVTSTQCLFIPAKGSLEPLVRYGKVDSREQLDRYFAWHGKNNVYGYDKTTPLIELLAPDGAGDPKKLDSETWLKMTGDDGDQLAKIRYSFGPDITKPKSFTSTRAGDLRAISFLTPRSDNSPEVGINAELPKPVADE